MAEDVGPRLSARINVLLNGRTAYWLAQHSGLSITYCDRVIKGRVRSPTYDTLKKLSLVFGLTVEVLLYGDEDPDPWELVRNNGLSANWIEDMIEYGVEMDPDQRKSIHETARLFAEQREKRIRKELDKKAKKHPKPETGAP